MNKDLLINNISKLLNLAESEKEFAFRKTIEKVSEKLKYYDALRIEKLGVFQLKKEPMPRYERSQLLPSAPKEKRTLVYSPPFEKLEGDIKSLFLTLDLDDLNLTVNDDVDKVFSISVNKPLIPLSETNEDIFVDFKSTGEKDINTDLEFKITELVETSEILKDYDIWEDYLNRGENENDRDSNRLDDEIDLNTIMFNESFTKASATPKDNYSENENEFVAPAGAPLDDDLRAFEEISRIERKFGNTIDQEIDNLSRKPDTHTEDELNSSAVEEPLVGLHNLNEELKSINTDNEIPEDQVEQNYDEFEMPNNLEVDESIGESFSDIEEIKESSKLVDETENELEVEQTDGEQNQEEDDSVFDDVEEYLDEEGDAKKIVDEIVSDEQEASNQIEETEDQELSVVNEAEIAQQETDSVEEDVKKDPTATNELKQDVDEVPVYKKPFIIYSAVGLVILLILFLLFYPSGDDERSEVVEEIVPQISQEQTTPIIEEEAEKPNITPDIPKDQPASERKGLYRKISTDVQAANQIYYDGEVYSVQVSSWRSATIAEREVNRLIQAGHDAFIYQVFLESKGSTWNRVRIGYFSTLEDAEDFLVKNKF